MKHAGGQGSINETAIPVKIRNELLVNKYCWGGMIRDTLYACGLRWNDQPEGDSAAIIPLVLVC